jgi:hypothetical protein
MHLNRSTTAIWAIALLATGFASNLFLTCGSNLVAFALVAALTLGLRRGSLLALGIWLESQLLGFAVFGYPHTPMTVAWGAALGAGTLLAAVVGNACAARGSVIAFAAAFAAYELALAAFALATGDGLAAFTPAIVGQLFVSNAALAISGLVLYRLVCAAEAGIVSVFSQSRHS